MRAMARRMGFTLVEILIVVVILGILAAIVIPQYASAVDDSAATATYNELQKIRRHLSVYMSRHNGTPPNVQEGNGTWGEIVGKGGEYLMSAPVNAWVGGDNSRVIKFGIGPDSTYQTNYGWIFDPGTGNVWAGSFDINDQPLPKN